MGKRYIKTNIDIVHKMIKAIIFDYGGLFVNDSDEDMFKEIANEFNVSIEDVYKYVHEFIDDYQTGKMSDEEFWRKVAEKTDRELPKDYLGFWAKIYDKHTHEIPEMFEFARELKKKGYMIAILSNIIPPITRYVREMHDLDFFDYLLFSDEIGARKPHRKMYDITLDKIGCKPEECVFIDDKEENVTAAKNIGIQGFVFKDIDTLRKDFGSIGIEI